MKVYISYADLKYIFDYFYFRKIKSDKIIPLLINSFTELIKNNHQNPKTPIDI